MVKMVRLVVLVLIVCLPISAFAETIFLKSGKTIEGKLIEKTDKYIKIDFQGVPLTYFLDEVESVDNEKIESNILKEDPNLSLGKTPQQIFKEASEATVFIEASGPKGTNRGSGFIIDKKGVVVTNYHVINSANNISIRSKNGTELIPKKVLNFDMLKDICIFVVSTNKDLDYLKVGDEHKIEIGEKLYVIGNPLGYKYAFSDGLLSQVNVERYRRLIGFTCPISPGNSGGPLLNWEGEVVGIVTESIASYEGRVQNLNFAVGINEVNLLLKDPENISMEDFYKMQDSNALFFQAVYQEPDDDRVLGILNELLESHCKYSGKFCFQIEMELLRINSLRLNKLMELTGQVLNGSRSITKEELDSGLRFCKSVSELINACGGVEELIKGYRTYFDPSEEAMRNAISYTFTSHMFNQGALYVLKGDFVNANVCLKYLKKYGSTLADLLEQTIKSQERK